MRNLKLIANGLLICTLLCFVATGCGQKSAMNPEQELEEQQAIEETQQEVNEEEAMIEQEEGEVASEEMEQEEAAAEEKEEIALEEETNQ